jgi:hypothetical protein
MALFPVNQNGQWFTAKAYDANLDTVGDIKVNSDNTGTPANATKIWFEYKDTAGMKRSEVINKNNGGRITVVPAAAMAWTPKGVTITFDGTVSDPINGEVYGIYINQRNYHALGDNEFMELGAEVRYGSKFNFDVESTLVTTAGEAVINNVRLLMVALKQAFVRNLGADKDLYTVTVASSATSAGVITVLPKEQDWIQGTMQAERVNLDTQDVFLSNVTINTIERNDWAAIAATTGTPIVNTKDIADMEWFYLGEHGDTQRLMGYPYANAATIKGSIYKVDPTNAYGYDLIVIHHAYVGSGNAVQKSEKDIMIALPLAGATTHTAADAFLGAVAGYFGISNSYDTIAEYDGKAKTFEF